MDRRRGTSGIVDDQDWSARVTEIAPIFRYVDNSAGGEKGLIAKLFSIPILPTRAGYAVEFGQRKLTTGTVAKLLSEQGWGALFMDGEAVSPLETRPAAGGGTITLAREWIAPSNINDLFAKYDVPGDFDCLVIDIDGLDYWVWEALEQRYSPSLVIVEFNAHVGHGVAATIEPDEGWRYRPAKNYGASITALHALAERKGYRLIHVHGCWNLYFARKELQIPAELVINTPLSASELAVLTDMVAFYDGFCAGHRPSWSEAPPPDVSRAPWMILAPAGESTEVDLEDISISVPGGTNDDDGCMTRRIGETASAMYPLIREAGFINFVDIGADVGLESIRANRMCPKIRSIAVESDPRLVRLLRRNFARHGLSDADVVTAIAGEQELPSAPLSLGSSCTLESGVSEADGPPTRVPMVRMDRILDTLGVQGPTFFRVDTRGFELQVLSGLAPWLRTSSDWMLKMDFAPYCLLRQGTDPARLLADLCTTYEATEFPARIAFGTPSLDSLFSRPIRTDQVGDFLAHVLSLRKAGRGCVDLLLRPAQEIDG